MLLVTRTELAAHVLEGACVQSPGKHCMTFTCSAICAEPASAPELLGGFHVSNHQVRTGLAHVRRSCATKLLYLCCKVLARPFGQVGEAQHTLCKRGEEVAGEWQALLLFLAVEHPLTPDHWHIWMGLEYSLQAMGCS